jgi:hypothetical protein
MLCCAVLCCAVQALVDVLQQGGCSELISLDLRGNTLSPEAEALLVGVDYASNCCLLRPRYHLHTGMTQDADPDAMYVDHLSARVCFASHWVLEGQDFCKPSVCSCEQYEFYQQCSQ